MDKKKLTGSCACGEVRYQLMRDPMFTHCCHCTQCQTLSGSAFAINTIIENDSIELQSGTLMETDGLSESGRPHLVYRCATCKTSLWSDYGGRPNYRFVRVGTLDKPHGIKPDAHIFVRSQVPWVVIPEDQKAFDIFYELEKEWPPEKLERRRLAVGG